MRAKFNSRVVVLAVVLAGLTLAPALAQRGIVDLAPQDKGGLGPPVPPEFVGTYLFEADGSVALQWQAVSGLITLNADGCATASAVLPMRNRTHSHLQTHGVWGALGKDRTKGRFLTLRHDSFGHLSVIERMTVVVDFREPLGGATGTMVIESFLPEQLNDLLGPNTHQVPRAGTTEGGIVLRRLGLD